MRGHVPSYQLVSPASLADALAALAREPGVWQPFAGGTDLMVLLESGKLPHKNYLNIWNLAALRGIEVSTEHVTLGALTTYTEVQSHDVLGEEFPMLCRKTEAVLQDTTLDESAIESARQELSREIFPIDDIRSTRDYRLIVSLNVLEDFLRQLRST